MTHIMQPTQIEPQGLEAQRDYCYDYYQTNVRPAVMVAEAEQAAEAPRGPE